MPAPLALKNIECLESAESVAFNKGQLMSAQSMKQPPTKHKKSSYKQGAGASFCMAPRSDR
jgi:hypothetical protein